MIQIQIFSGYDLEELQLQVNRFLSNANWGIIDIKICNEVEYVIMVIYE